MKPQQLTVLTPPELAGAEEAVWITCLLRLGVGRVHIRKPEATAEELASLLDAIPRELRRRCYLSHHTELVRAYQLGGVHLSVRDWRKLRGRPEELLPWQELGVSCHSREELEDLPVRPDYAYLSPVAPSLSKAGYGDAPRWTEGELAQLCAETPFPLVALGGILPERAEDFLALGFAGVASLGYWQGLSLSQLPEALADFTAPRVLLCGGLDPTAEAGITADVRHAERLGAKATTLATALTRQHTRHFAGLTPVTEKDLVGQLDALAQGASPAVAKIGLVTSLAQVLCLSREIRQRFPRCLILWDPVLRTSSGYRLLADDAPEAFAEAIRAVDFLLPNAYEQTHLFAGDDPAILAQRWQTTLLCKSYQRTATTVTDSAFLPSGERIEVTTSLGGEDRHGTGCLYGTELAVALASGDPLGRAMGVAQRAVTHLRHAWTLPARSVRAQLGRRMFITHGATPAEVLRQTAEVLRYGLADIVQLRMKWANEATFLAVAREVLALCRSYSVPLLVNDRVEVARLIGAEGVHLGPEDLSPLEARALLGAEALIGLTCHNRAELDHALAEPIDYVGLGPYRYTKTKERLAPVLGLEGYYQLQLDAYPLPVYAIGGIHLDEAPRLLATGVYGLAMSGGLLQCLPHEVDSDSSDPLSPSSRTLSKLC